jgi:holo-[acyl-carrier protein] synthase
MMAAPQARQSAALLTHLDVGQLWEPVIKPMLIGSIPPGVIHRRSHFMFSPTGVCGRFRPAKVETGGAGQGTASGTGRGASRTNGGKGKQGVIIGIGSDLIDIRRIEKTLERHGERFIRRCFTDVERAKSDRRALRAASYAKRFAAKEACSKALGTGLSRGVFWRDMGVVNLPGGKPTMQLTGGAAERLQGDDTGRHDSAPFI